MDCPANGSLEGLCGLLAVGRTLSAGVELCSRPRAAGRAAHMSVMSGFPLRLTPGSQPAVENAPEWRAPWGSRASHNTYEPWVPQLEESWGVGTEGSGLSAAPVGGAVADAGCSFIRYTLGTTWGKATSQNLWPEFQILQFFLLERCPWLDRSPGAQQRAYACLHSECR